jgi:hypothetical protein
MNPAEFGLGLKCREFFALASRELAFPPTPLLLRFFSPVPLSVDVRPWGLPLPLRFSPLPGSSLDFTEVSMGDAASGRGSDEPPESGPPSFGGDPELPNILFSRPPWEEKLLLLFPASLLTWPDVSREETCRSRNAGGSW